MIIQAKRVQLISEEDQPDKFTRIQCQFHISEVAFLEAEQKNNWVNPKRPETRVIFKTGHEYVIQYHYGSLSKLHAEYHQCEIIKGEA